MQENTKKPAIRFTGFNDAWEQRKLSTLYAQLNERNNDMLSYDKTLSVATMKYKSDGNGASDSSLTNYKRLRLGDIAFEGHTSKEFRYGRFVLNDVGDGIMSPRFSALRPVGKLPIHFWKYYIHYEPIMRHILVNSTKAGTMMNELVVPEFLGQSVLVPSKQEQQAIGEFFSNLDNLITLHQRKYSMLMNIKKSMLEKMFPRNGAKVPEIRFAGFTDAWEQRKLGDVGKARSGVGFPDSEQGGTTGTPFFKVSDMNLDGNENEMTAANNYVTAAQIAAHRWSPIEELPAIFFAKVGAAVMLNRKRLCRFPFLLDNNTMAYSLNNTKWNADFAKALFETLDLTSLVQVGALPSYNAGDIEAMEILLPSLSEQSQIGAFFKKIDNLITLHQRELERLQNIKKACLEKMFV